jgi:hypothetical protein
MLLLVNFLPAGDIEKMTRPMEMLGTSWEPFTRELAQQALNHDFYLNRPVQQYPGQQTNFLGMDLDARFAHMLKQWRLLNFLDQVNVGNVFGNKDTGQPSVFGAQRQLTDLTPLERAVKAITSVKTYPYDVQQSQQYAMGAARHEIGQLKGDLMTEYKKGPAMNQQNIVNIIQRMQQVQKKMSGGNY